MNRTLTSLCLATCSAALTSNASPQDGNAMSTEQAVAVCRQYLSAETAEAKGPLLRSLPAYRDPIPPVIEALTPKRGSQTGSRGLSGTVRFETPSLREKHKDDHLYYHVPEGHDSSAPTGLLIYMHGGGPGTKREYAGEVIDPAAKYANGIAFLLNETPYVVVAPSAPWNPKSYSRWALPEAEEYLAAVVAESMSRFSIDPNRIALGGTSMGGMGAMALAVRIPDKFAAVYAGSASWTWAYWRSAIGTPLFLIHGAHDAVPPGTPGKSLRPKFTDVFFAREAHRLLAKYEVEHIYAEHEGGHSSAEAKPAIKRFLRWMRGRKRDAYATRVFAVSHGDANVYQPHNRWVTIEELGEGTLDFDGCALVDSRGGWEQTLEQFNKSRVVARSARKPGGYVDATNLGDNAFALTTRNVKKLSLWFHPKMAELEKPIRLTVNGKSQKIEVRPSLATALRSYDRRKDWGLIYHAEAAVEVESE